MRTREYRLRGGMGATLPAPWPLPIQPPLTSRPAGGTRTSAPPRGPPRIFFYMSVNNSISPATGAATGRLKINRALVYREHAGLQNRRGEFDSLMPCQIRTKKRKPAHQWDGEAGQASSMQEEGDAILANPGDAEVDE